MLDKIIIFLIRLCLSVSCVLILIAFTFAYPPAMLLDYLRGTYRSGEFTKGFIEIFGDGISTIGAVWTNDFRI